MAPAIGTLKADLADGKQAVGFWIHSFSPVAAEILSLSGYDCGLIDMEHGPGSNLDTTRVLQAMNGGRATPLARVPVNDPVVIKRALDSGIHGIMIPNVSNASEAKAAVEACLYPPDGKRGMAPGIIRASGYGYEAADYAGRINRDLLIICQIETVAGVTNAEEIASVEGVDLLFIGPNDLAGDAGHSNQPDHPEVLALRRQVEGAVKKAGKWIGSIETSARLGPDLIAEGYHLVIGDSDVGHLVQGARNSLKRYGRQSA